MNQFYRLYERVILPQVGAKSADNSILPQIDAQLQDHIIFSIPWGLNAKCS